MIIDCHGHFTTQPSQFAAFRKAQLAALDDPKHVPARSSVKVTDDELRESLEPKQLRLQRERGIDLTLISPIAGQMGHHLGNAATSLYWSEVCNDLIHRVCALYPQSFAAVCQLPQSPGVSPANCVDELERCVTELGFVGCNLNPDPSGGNWTEPRLDDRSWYPLYEKMVELDVPAMIHVSASCNPHFFPHAGSHYIVGDTAAFMELLTSRLFQDFPTLKFVIPHGGGAVPYQWGRYRGLAQRHKWTPLPELLKNVYFDTCLYDRNGMELLTKAVPKENILFGSEMLGAVKGVDPETGHDYDDTKRSLDAVTTLTAEERAGIFEGNARRVYPRLDALIARSFAPRSTHAISLMS